MIFCVRMTTAGSSTEKKWRSFLALYVFGVDKVVNRLQVIK